MMSLFVVLLAIGFPGGSYTSYQITLYFPLLRQVIEGNDHLDRYGSQAIRIDRARRDVVRRARAEQQLPGHHAKRDEAWRVYTHRCQILPALSKEPTSPDVLCESAQYLAA